jgi:Raf kinase inhibitor-like YbhB/YbcL family protein
MQLSSPAFEKGGKIPSKYTCDGSNINPELHIHDVPANTATLVLIMDDPDVPKSLRPDGMYDHWIVYNITKETRVIEENSEPPGMVCKNTGNTLGYTGPCPPDREHRYFFKLYALDKSLSLNPGPTKQDIERAMDGHILAKAELMGTYVRHPK